MTPMIEAAEREELASQLESKARHNQSFNITAGVARKLAALLRAGPSPVVTDEMVDARVDDPRLVKELCILLHGIGGHIVPEDAMELALFSAAKILAASETGMAWPNVFINGKKYSTEAISNYARKLSGTQISITVAALKGLGGLDSTYQFFKEMPDKEDRLLSVNTVINVEEGDKFYGVPPCIMAADQAALSVQAPRSLLFEPTFEMKQAGAAAINAEHRRQVYAEPVAEACWKAMVKLLPSVQAPSSEPIREELIFTTATGQLRRVIRDRLQNGEMLKDIAKDYGVVPDTIGKIKQGKTWRWLP